MILLVFFFPLAVYLLILGFINRHRHPLIVSGVWDGIGLIFGVSGFLLFAGPAVLSMVSERWRSFWLLGKGDISLAAAEGAWPLWAFLAFLYFLVIVTGTAMYLWSQRRLTAIYNTNPDLVEHVLIDICKELGINPVRSGDLFLFEPSVGEREQTAIVSNPIRHLTIAGRPSPSRRGLDYGEEQTTMLELDSFPLMHHVTLRWEPAASPIRRIVEKGMSRRLSETLPDDALLGGWLLALGFILLSFDFASVFFLVLRNLLPFLR